MKAGLLNYSEAKTFINESIYLCFEQSGELRLGLSCDLLPGFQLTFSERSTLPILVREREVFQGVRILCNN